MTPLLDLDPSTYKSHALHDLGALYPLTNCWADVVIEVLHAHGDEPLACLGAALSIDHEGDQFTFFKPRAQDLEDLYGVDIHEMQPYRRLRDQVREQLDRRRTVIVETDAWWLPDTSGDSYRREHVKTSIAVADLDEVAQRLVYFHNGGLYELTGEDFTNTLSEESPGLPPYVELVRFDAGPGLAGMDLHAAARELLPLHLSRRPGTNPFISFLAQVERELPLLVDLDEQQVHGLAFATTRMAGAAAVLSAAHVRWLLGDKAEAAAACFDKVAGTTRTLTVRFARKRAFDPAPLVEGMAKDWSEALERLDELAD